VCSPVGGDQGVLYGVGGFLAVAEGAQRHRPEPVAVPADYLGEGMRIAVHVPGEELAVVSGVADGVVQRRPLPWSSVRGLSS
jgi:hypothetical protein